ncbi:recombination protein O N-terminal domain-containing protein [Candidatus Kaiserbacteria bacterium]|nr:recombination protein O N-terminal domain-containing protein [Candidatus Kaiserbacteria bacterium]
MRHKYETHGIVLARLPLGEANASITLLTRELGVVRARAQGVRARGAKLAPALATFAESSLVLVRGREGWRLAGAVLEENWFKRLARAAPRRRAARVSGLLLRLVAGEAHDPALFSIMRGFFEALAALPLSKNFDTEEDMHEAAEVLAALRILKTLGLDVGKIPGAPAEFTRTALATVVQHAPAYIQRINHGIAASGL